MNNEARMQLVEDAMTIVAEGMALPYEHMKYGMTADEYEVCKPGMLKYARFCVQELSKSTIEVTAEVLARCAYIFISDMDRRFLESNPEDGPEGPFSFEGTRTGRLSSVQPNIQRMPMRTEVGNAVLAAVRPVH